MARRFPTPVTAEEYDRMIADGLLTAFDRVELIEGEIVEKRSEGDAHAMCVATLNDLFRFRAPAELAIMVNAPTWMAPDSVPEPDVFLIRRRPLETRRRPRPEDVALVIEVCDTSLAWDRRVKVPLYARAGIPEVWLVDLNGERLLRFRNPPPAPIGGWIPGGAAPAWQQEDVLSRGQALAPAACPDTRLTVDEILGQAPGPLRA